MAAPFAAPDNPPDSSAFSAAKKGSSAITPDSPSVAPPLTDALYAGEPIVSALPGVAHSRELRYRVFISYTHSDRDKVAHLDQILRQQGLTPMWDRKFVYGRGFHEQIRNYIAHAHIFMPLLTDQAEAREWVHQEIGYAMALGIPVLPVRLGGRMGPPADALIQPLLALSVSEVADIALRLDYGTIDRLIRHHPAAASGLYECAEWAETRARLMANYARDVIDLGGLGFVRQKGGLSSFHIPCEPISHRYWQERYGSQQRGQEHCHLLRQERLALEEHARGTGCRIIINPGLTFKLYGPLARLSRLKALLRFLESSEQAGFLCEVAIDAHLARDESLTLVGDWYMAQSISAQIGLGYRQTMFTRHALSVLRRVDDFDQEFEESLARLGWPPDCSRSYAMEHIRSLISKISGNNTPISTAETDPIAG